MKLRLEKISLNEKKQDDYVRLTEKQLSQQLKDKKQQNLIRIFMLWVLIMQHTKMVSLSLPTKVEPC